MLEDAACLTKAPTKRFKANDLGSQEPLMLNTVEPHTSRRAARNAPKQDLRDWLAQMEEAGELVTVTGADRDEEIGGIVDIYQRTMGAPAVMFEGIPGFPPRHRGVANILTSVRRINLT